MNNAETPGWGLCMGGSLHTDDGKPSHLLQKGVSMKDVLKFAAMLCVAALVWMVVNPIHVIVSIIVTMFPVVMITLCVGLAVAGYRMMFNSDLNDEEEEV